MGSLLALYALVWTLYGTLAKCSQDIHADMGEMLAWSYPLALGTPKHPPLGSWIAGLWFGVFPRSDWAYYFLAMVLATFALWIAWRLSRDCLASEKRIIGVALLTFVPFYNFHALKFNANTVLTPLWAATTWWFLRSLWTHELRPSVLAGAGAAAAMLGKYWSAVLLAGLGAAAFTSPQRNYFRSMAPLITIVTGALLIAPHVSWLFLHDFAPLNYALEVHADTREKALVKAALFIFGVVSFASVPIIITFLAAKPSWSTVKDMLWPSCYRRRTIVVTFVAPILIAAVVSVSLRILAADVWMIPAMTLLPVVLLSPPTIEITRESAIRILTAALIFPVLMVAVSPGIALAIHLRGLKEDAGHYQLLSQAVQRTWDEESKEKLTILGGDPSLVYSVAFYLKTMPESFSVLSPESAAWINAQALKHQGFAIVCPEIKTPCRSRLLQYAGQFTVAKIVTVELSRTFLGIHDSPASYMILLAPPQLGVDSSRQNQ